jgi:hypothetical protein
MTGGPIQSDRLQLPQPIPRAIGCETRQSKTPAAGPHRTQPPSAQTLPAGSRKPPPNVTLQAGGIGCRSLMQLID